MLFRLGLSLRENMLQGHSGWCTPYFGSSVLRESCSPECSLHPAIPTRACWRLQLKEFLQPLKPGLLKLPCENCSLYPVSGLVGIGWWWWSPEGIYIHGVLPREVLLDTSPLHELLTSRWMPAYCLSSSGGQYSNIWLKVTDPEDQLWVASHLQGEFRWTAAKRGAPWWVVVTSTSQFLSL